MSVEESIRRGIALENRVLEAAIKALTKELRNRQPVKIVKSKARKDTKDPCTIQRVEQDWQAFAQQQPECKAVCKKYTTSRAGTNTGRNPSPRLIPWRWKRS